LLLAAALALAGCSSDGGVSTSTSVSYGGYYGPGWYGGYYYDSYPPVIITDPDRPERPENRPERPTTLPAEVNRPSVAPARPATSTRPTTRPSPRPATRPMPRAGGFRR
jgi:hypothetical protein